MKLSSNEQSIEMQGAGAATAFTIKGSSKAFQILSSGLYANKPMAIIRELSCNAVDAHVMNGNQDKPFEIKLPNSLDSQFYVRDFGPGLSDQGIKKLYTTYFDSTKTESNEFIGGLGLGSKSPFSYTDTFTVESIHNGEKRIYAAYIDEEGLPQIRNFGDAIKTDEPSGLKVSFPVKKDDYQRFEGEARRVLQFFDPPPKTLGISEITPLVPLKTSGNVSTYDDIPGWVHRSYYNRDKKTFIRMGSVIYPMDWEAANLTEHPLYVHFFSQISKNLILNLPIGTVEVAASRESLQYDARSRKELQASIVHFAEEILNVIDAEATKIVQKNPAFVAQKKIYKLQQEWGFPFAEVAGQLGKLTTKKYPWLEVLAEKKFPKKTFKTFSVYYQQKGNRQSHLLKDGTYLRNQNVTEALMLPSTSTMFIECDTKGHATVTKAMLDSTPTEKYYKGESYDDAFVIVPESMKLIGTQEYEAEKTMLQNMLGGPTIRKTSEGQHLLQRRSKATAAANEVEGVLMSERQSRYYGAVDRHPIPVNDIKAWYPIVGRDQNPTVDILDEEGNISPKEMDFWTVQKHYNALKEKLKGLGVDLPEIKNIAGVSQKHKKMMTDANIPTLWDIVEQAIKTPKVQAFLNKHNRQMDLTVSGGSYSKKYQGTSVFMDYVTKHSAQFKKLGSGWNDFLGIQKQPELLDTLKNLFEKSDYTKRFGLIEPQRVYASQVYYNLIHSQPLVGAMMLGFNGAPSAEQARIHKAILDYLEENKIDLDVSAGLIPPQSP